MKNTMYEKLVVHNLDKIPNGLSYMDRYEVSKLDDYDFKEILSLGVDEIWYWYATAPYEGSGKMILRKGSLYDIWDLGHCSCYGATDRKGEPNWRELKDIERSDDFNKEVTELLEALND